MPKPKNGPGGHGGAPRGGFQKPKNMGAFKAVGYPEDVGEYYMRENYKAHTCTCLLYTSRCV